MTRFAIKVARHWTTTPIILKDRWQPAFLRSFATLDEACLAMDNIVRRDHAMPPRVPITRREIREAMELNARLTRIEGVKRGAVAVLPGVSSQAGLASFRGGAL